MNENPIPIFDSLQQLKDSPLPSHLENTLNAQQKQDFSHARDFLLSYRGSTDTFNSYRKEIERLLQWSWWVENKTLIDLKRIDFENYIEFCQNPPKTWIGKSQKARFLDSEGQRCPNPAWRPFVLMSESTKKKYIFSQKSLSQLFSTLSSFFNYLLQEDYVSQNPISQIRQKSKYFRKHQTKHKIRRLTELQWSYVIETASTLAEKDKTLHERTLFIMSCLYGMYLRVSELTANARWVPQMSDFKRDNEGNWWFTTVGKGNKERDISVSDTMLSALKRYRLHLKLTPLPSPSEDFPLIPKSKSSEPISSTRQIRRIVQHCFDCAIQKLNSDGFVEEAGQLEDATVHWLRHTGISDDVKTRPREHVRDDAGHSSSAITDKYIDIDLKERHKSARKKRITPDE